LAVECLPGLFLGPVAYYFAAEFPFRVISQTLIFSPWCLPVSALLAQRLLGAAPRDGFGVKLRPDLAPPLGGGPSPLLAGQPGRRRRGWVAGNGRGNDNYCRRGAGPCWVLGLSGAAVTRPRDRVKRLVRGAQNRGLASTVSALIFALWPCCCFWAWSLVLLQLWWWWA